MILLRDYLWKKSLAVLRRPDVRTRTSTTPADVPSIRIRLHFYQVIFVYRKHFYQDKNVSQQHFYQDKNVFRQHFYQVIFVLDEEH